MILNDFTNEYSSVSNYLNEGKEFLEACSSLFKTYCEKAFAYTKRFYCSGSSSKNSDLINDLNKQTSELYNQIKLLNSKSLNFTIAITKIQALDITNLALKSEIDDFVSSSFALLKTISNIILQEKDGVRKGDFLNELFVYIDDIISSYAFLTKISMHLNLIESEIMEPIPQNIATADLSMLVLRSEKASINFSEVTNDLSLLSSFMDNLELILDNRPNHITCFIRKIETGSLRIVFGGTTIELSCISDIIQAITNAIKTFRLTTVEKRIAEETANSLHLDNDEKALSIINSKIDEICEKLDLDPSKPEDKETIQRLCLPVVKYINSNPVGCIGEFHYNLSDEIKLLEDIYFFNKD